MLHARADAAGASATGARSSACARATATWSSTRSSTPSATRRAGSPALMMGATMLPHAGVRRRRGAAPHPRERISVLPGPPTLYQTILNHPDRGEHDLSSLRLSVTGAAAIPVELILRMREELDVRDDHHRVRPHRGVRHRHDVPLRRRPRDHRHHVGRAPSPASRCASSTTTATRCRAASRARSWSAATTSCTATSTTPSETAATIDADGWLHTGDVGVMDERGYLRITDRIKDMFIVGGFNAYPAEIENLLLRNPTIAQVAVVGVPDERMGEVGMAFVVLRPGDDRHRRGARRPGAGPRWRTTRSRASSSSSTSCPLNASGQGAEVRAPGAGEQAALSAAVMPAA